MSSKEYELFLFFAQNPELVLSETQIYEGVWNSDKDFHSSIAKPIHRLRQKIEPDQRNPFLVSSVSNRERRQGSRNSLPPFLFSFVGGKKHYKKV